MLRTQLDAATVVEAVLAGRSLTTVLQKARCADPPLTNQQRSAIQDISYGTLRFYGQLNALLELLLNKPLNDMRLRCLLLIGLYQLQYSKTAPHVIVNHAVSASRSLGKNKYLQGFVNAVLRHFLRQRESLLQKAAESDTARYSYPKWWINKIRRQYPDDYQTILEAGNQRPPLTLRINQRKISITGYMQLLENSGLNAQSLSENAVILNKPVPVDQIPGFTEGVVTVQDWGAQFAAPLLDVHDSMRVLDACAAPGGKSTHLLEIADIDLTVLDCDTERLTRIEQNLDRAKMNAARVICGDASQPAHWWDRQPFDRILADVPCSASGVVRRHPDIKWLRQENDLSGFSIRQHSILNALWSTLKNNGKLLYTTCSIFAEENHLQIEAFLSQHSDASQLLLAQNEMDKGQLLPSIQHDGFFYALLQKN